MKLEIELDLNKIDYDAINKQIAEKVAELNIKETYDIESKINTKINNKISISSSTNYTSHQKSLRNHNPRSTDIICPILLPNCPWSHDIHHFQNILPYICKFFHDNEYNLRNYSNYK